MDHISIAAGRRRYWSLLRYGRFASNRSAESARTPSLAICSGVAFQINEMGGTKFSRRPIGIIQKHSDEVSIPPETVEACALCPEPLVMHSGTGGELTEDAAPALQVRWSLCSDRFGGD